MIHYAMNIDCELAQTISAFSSEDPGFVAIIGRTFTLSNEALTVTYNKSVEEIEELKKGLPGTIAKGREECLKQCRG